MACYLMLLDNGNKFGRELVELIFSLGLHGLELAGSSDNY